MSFFQRVAAWLANEAVTNSVLLVCSIFAFIAQNFTLVFLILLFSCLFFSSWWSFHNWNEDYLRHPTLLYIMQIYILACAHLLDSFSFNLYLFLLLSLLFWYCIYTIWNWTEVAEWFLMSTRLRKIIFSICQSVLIFLLLLLLLLQLAKSQTFQKFAQRTHEHATKISHHGQLCEKTEGKALSAW